MPSPDSIPTRAIRALCALTGLGLVVAGSFPGVRSRAAGAVVVHHVGYQATVAGWTSWYGSYDMGSIGSAWCIDHGIAAPDPAYGYSPTTVADHDPATTRAMAWALGRYGPDAARPTAAALTLVLHDLAGAVYPQGRIDVDRMTVAGLAGFGGDEAAVLARARQIKADAVSHAALTPPLQVTATRDAGGPDVVVRVTDRDGRPVAGATLDGAAGVPAGTVTDATGRARRPVSPPGTGPVSVDVTVPDLSLTAWAPPRAAAQRVARPGTTHLRITVPALPAPTTTTTVRPTTTTAAPPTTTTVRPTTTTAAPPTTTTAVAAKVPAPVVAASVTPVVVPAVPVAPPAGPARPELPFTGAPVGSLALIGLGVAFFGVAALLAS